MLLTGHQPNYLPYLGFFEKIHQADHFLIVDNVQFVKRGPFGWIHRNKIRTPQGWQWLSLECLTKGKYTQKINEVELKNSPVLKKHWRSIEVNYKKSPFFKDYQQPFKEIYLDHDWNLMCDLNIALIKAILKALDITTPVDTTSSLNIEGKATELIKNMCECMGASHYLSGMHGKDYLDMDLLTQHNVTIEFQEFHHPTYRQCWGGDFQPFMATIDLIFNHGPQAKNILLTSG